MYALTNSEYILRKSDFANIPMDTGNTDYIDYLAWLAEGNIPEPATADLLQVERDRLHRLVNGQYAQRMSAVALPYLQYERESWTIQLQEAQALVADPGAVTPWIDACAVQRGLERGELAQRILGKDSAYRFISGQLTGARQAHEDAIDALTSIAAAQAYDLGRGWPVF